MDHTINGQSPRTSRESLDLGGQESLALLAGVSLGRVVFTLNAMPTVRPVNHIVDEDAIIIRSHLGAAIVSHASINGAVVAYEADDLDPVHRVGWSVVVVGLARIVTEPDAIARYQPRLLPWVNSKMEQFVSIHATIVTGSRFTDGAAPESPVGTD